MTGLPVRRRWHEHAGRLVGATLRMALPVLLFASQYFTQRQCPMLIPTFVIFAVWIGLGTARSLEARSIPHNSCPPFHSLVFFAH